ncbi:MAG: hydrolase [Deltaproteobacteria bacterium]|nr:hydrolase [Deltaproteobacteria bacterium]
MTTAAAGRNHRIAAVVLGVVLGGCSGDPVSPGGGDAGAGEGPGPGDRPAADPAGDPSGPIDTGYDPEPLQDSPFNVLFDNSHGEQAGNADWVIDDNWPNPSPASPAAAESWSGAYSSWGYDLWHSGRYVVKTLPPSGRITFNDSGNALDLSGFDLFVLPEPNSPFSLAEKNAILDFVNAGGGLFMISDHGDSDRDGDGWDACRALNDLIVTNDRVMDPFGIQLSCNSFTEHPIVNIANLPESRVIHGPFGNVQAMSVYAGSALNLTPGHAGVRGIFWRNSYPHTTTNVDFAVSKYGAGRVAVVGDSSPADDGTANPGNTNIFNGWTEAGVTNNVLFLNTSAWLVRDSGR